MTEQADRAGGDGVRWQRVNAEPFEYAIQQGPHGDEFVKLLNGSCLRRAAPPSGNAGEGAVEVKILDWEDTSHDRGDGTREISGYEADSGFGPWYVISQYFGSDSFGFEIDFDGTKIGDSDSADAAKDVAQDHYAQRIRAAIAAVPPRSAPDALREAIARALFNHWKAINRSYDWIEYKKWYQDYWGGFADVVLAFPAPVPSGEGSDAVVGTNAGLVMSIVRDNLMTRRGYTPYCGRANTCSYGMPRTTFKQGQFECPCGWRSGFDPKFIAEYEAKWATEVAPADGNTP